MPINETNSGTQVARTTLLVARFWGVAGDSGHAGHPVYRVQAQRLEAQPEALKGG
jgi:hypothetical protein